LNHSYSSFFSSLLRSSITFLIFAFWLLCQLILFGFEQLIDCSRKSCVPFFLSAFSRGIRNRAIFLASLSSSILLFCFLANCLLVKHHDLRFLIFCFDLLMLLSLNKPDFHQLHLLYFLWHLQLRVFFCHLLLFSFPIQNLKQDRCNIKSFLLNKSIVKSDDLSNMKIISFFSSRYPCGKYLILYWQFVLYHQIPGPNLSC
jgi:hypothetical protein